MREQPSILVVPLGSNAHTLLNGAPIAALRRRLKYASLFFDQLFLESGILRVSAGPQGSTSFIVPPSEDDPPRWQTAAQRKAAAASPFYLAMGVESSPGVPATTMHTVIASPTTISWSATLHPFASEFPADCDWVEFVRSQDPTGAADRLKRQWARDDERNPALKAAMPIDFVRSRVVDQADGDLALAAVSGVSTSLDGLHLQVVAQRFSDDSSWHIRGFAIPVLFPKVGDLSWNDVAKLRRDRHIARFRAVLKEVEEEAGIEALAGDIESATHHAFERHLADAAGGLEGVAVALGRVIAGFVIGGASGMATIGIAGPAGVVAGAALGTGVQAVLAAPKFVRQRRARSWLAVRNRLDSIAT